MSTLLLVFAALAAHGQAIPTGIGAYSSNATGNTIYWNPVPGATGYYVYAGTTAGGEVATPVGNPSGTSYYHSGLTTGQRYFYRVTALYGTSESPRSVEISAKPGSARSGWAWFYCVAGSNTVAVRYNAVPAATGYHILRYDGWSWTMVGNSTTGLYTDATAKNGILYTYKVRAYNADTDLEDSYQVSAVPGDAAPATPTGLTAVAYSSYINVYWNRVPGADGYVVFRSTTTGTEGLRPYTVLGNTDHFTDSSLAGGATYYYTIATLDPSGTGAQSAEVTAKVGAAWLPAPSLAAAGGVGKVTLNWTAVTGATYNVLYRRTGDSDWEMYQNLPSTTRTYVDTAVVAGNLYSYQVYAGNAATRSGNYSAVASAKVGAKLLKAPGGFYVRAGGTYNSLYCDPVPGAQSYNVYRSKSATAQALYVANVGSSYTDYNVTAGTRYFYKMSAVYKDNEGAKSAIASGKPGSTVLPTTQLAAYPVTNQINLFWNLVTDAVSYNVFRATGDGSWVGIKIGVVPAVGDAYGSFIDTTAVAGVYQTYRIAAVNADGQGDYSNNVQVVAGNGVLPAPTGSWTFNGSSYITIYTTPVPGATSYNVYRSTTPGVYGKNPIRVNVGTSWSDYSVTAGVTYYYRYAAVDLDGQSLLGPECSGTAGGTVPPAPLVALKAGPSSITLYWSESAGATGYDVFRAPMNGNYQLIAQNVVPRTYVDTTATAAVRYYYYVYPVNANGLGGRSNTVTGRLGAVAPAAPLGLYGYQGNQYAYITWDRVSGATYYNVYMSTTSGAEGNVPVATTTGLGYNFYSLVNTQPYYFQVTAVTNNQQGAKSYEVSVVPGSPRLTAVTLNAPVATTGNVALSWSSNSVATSYTIWKRINGGDWLMLARNVAATTYSDADVVAGAQYSYQVSPVDANGTGNYSNTQTVVAK